MKKENVVVKKGCHAELVSASTPLVTIQNKEEILNQVQDDNRRGFTLIELLVVVLIIGILAAVAVPKYQQVVDKSKVMPYVKLAWEIKRAEEVFYLANGYYTNDLRQLDVDYAAGCRFAAGYINFTACPDHILIDIASANNKAKGTVNVNFCPRTANWKGYDCEQERIFLYSIAFDHAGKNWTHYCSGNARGERLCNVVK